jgi:LysM repeat protein
VAVRPGNTAADIAKENQLAEWKLYKYNDLEKNQMINPGEILYLKPKRTSAPDQIHIMKRGETLHDVSQLYAIKLKSLRKMNQLTSNEEPVIGEEIYLSEKRETKPKTVKGPVPMSTASTIMRPAVQSASKNIPNTHEVQAGETIEQIADKYKTSVLNIVRWNDLEFAEVSTGQILALAPGAKFHLYEKSPRKGRKMGHITLVGADSAELLSRGRAARDVLYRGAEEAK